LKDGNKGFRQQDPAESALERVLSAFWVIGPFTPAKPANGAFYAS